MAYIVAHSWKDRENQYIQLVKVLYCKLTTNGKQLLAFHMRSGHQDLTSDLRGGRIFFFFVKKQTKETYSQFE